MILSKHNLRQPGSPPFLYRAFGLTISSEVALPELCAAEYKQEADVTIRYVPLQPEDYGCVGKTDQYQIAPDLLYLQIQNVGRYCVMGGKTILVDPIPGVPPESFRLYILGSCMGVLLLQRGLLPLHGSSVATAAGGILFLGDSGIGKSTLAAHFCTMGYSLVSDDICAIAFSHEEVAVLQPAYPQLKLLEDSLNHVPSIINDGELPAVIDEKYRIRDSFHFEDTPLKICRIFILEKADCTQIEISQLFGIQKFAALTEHIYRGFFIEQLNIASHQFRQCAQLCEQIALYRIVRPIDTFTLQALSSCIRACLASEFDPSC